MSDSTSTAPAGEQPESGDGQDKRDQQAACQATDAGAPPESNGTVVVRYGLMGNLGRFACKLDPAPQVHEKVVIRTDRGVELGEVVVVVGEEARPGVISAERLAAYRKASGQDRAAGASGSVLRPANRQDIIDHKHLEEQAREEGSFCREQIRKLKLPMKVITAEHLLGGERIVFYFGAESRVDFRELVRKLAAQYRTRIEMRQVGARDEAKLVGDYERCGQRCCCQTFLKYLKPVSMRMAKMQKATLDPSKISGRCGRLMCCLRFENATYEELRDRLPKRNTFVRSAEHVGKVIDTQILTQLVKLQLRDNTIVVVANEDILERNAEPPPPREEAPGRGGARETAAREEPTRETESKPPSDQKQTPAEQAETQSAQKSSRKRRRRRRRPRRKSKEQQQAQAGARQDKPSGGDPKQGDASQRGSGGDKKRRRPRRRRRKK